jgi:hypothetical protein
MRAAALLLVSALTLAVTACGAGQNNDVDPSPAPVEPTVFENWKDNNSATFAADGSEAPSAAVWAGKTSEGDNIFTFMRAALGTTWFADEITDARLFLKVAAGVKPARLRLGLVTGWWDGSLITYAEAKALIDESSAVTVDVADESDGWISVPMMDFVKTWISGDIQNNGFAISGETPGEVYTFVSIVGADTSESGIAYIKASGAVGERSLAHGKFGYTEMPLPDEEDAGGNCIAYALRDINMIFGGDLGADKGEMERIYRGTGPAGGADALADYFTRLVMDYVETHKDGLKVSRFRQLDDHDSEIDPSAEYRIAMRLGLQAVEGDEPDFAEEDTWDYHFWVQLNDGRWAQKFPTGPSEIVPCTSADVSPGKFPWDSGYYRSFKAHDYYTSKTIYFAVTKDVPEFTRHRGEMEDRVLS